MKKIINGKVYDTEKAQLIAEAHRPDHIEYATGKGLQQWLYQKKTGEYFLHADGATSDLANILDEYRPGKNIYPLTYEQAQKWSERELTAEKWEEIFGDPEDDDTTIRTTISLTASQTETIKQNAAKAGMTVSAYIAMRCAE